MWFAGKIVVDIPKFPVFQYSKYERLQKVIQSKDGKSQSIRLVFMVLAIQIVQKHLVHQNMLFHSSVQINFFKQFMERGPSQPSIFENIPIKKVIKKLSFHYDMKYLAACGSDNNVNVWNLGCKNKPLIFKGHTDEVLSLQYSPNSLLLASGSKDTTIRIWTHTVDGKSKTIKGHNGPVRSLNFSFDGQYLLSGSDDKTLKLWDIGTLKFKSSYTGHKHWVRSARFNKDATMIGSGGEDKKLILWDVETKKIRTQLDSHQGIINDVHFHPTEPWVISCSKDQTIKFHDIRNQKLVQHYDAHSDSVNSIAIHPSGNLMASVSNDCEIKLWDVRKGILSYTLYAHNGNLNACVFSKKGNYFATAGTDEKCVVWNTGILGSKENEGVKYFDMCETGHRADLRTIADPEDHKWIMKYCPNGTLQKERARSRPKSGARITSSKGFSKTKQEQPVIGKVEKNIIGSGKIEAEDLENKISQINNSIQKLEERIENTEQAVMMPQISDQ